MKTRYIAWCKKEYLNLAEYSILECMLDCVEYGVGDSVDDIITATTSPIIYQDEKYIVTEDADGYCYLLSIVAAM